MSTWTADGLTPAPRWGAAARRWFFRSICYYLVDEHAKHRIGEQDFPDVDLERFATTLVDQTPERFVEWVPTEGYAGGRFSAGEWRVEWSSVVATLQREASAFAPAISLEEWLRRDMTGQAPKGPGEPCMLNLLNRVTRGGGYRAMRAHYALLARWPRLCANCGTEFRGRRCTDKRCPTCVAAGKQGPARRDDHRGPTHG